MDYDSYREKFFVDPAPQPRFAYAGIHGTTLYFGDYAAAIDYYTRVLGAPVYVEGDHTRGWRIGDTWLTLLKGKDGNPQNVEVMITTQTPAEVDRLHAAFIEAGGKGEAPSDQLMYEPVRYGLVQDPFGANILIFSPLESGK